MQRELTAHGNDGMIHADRVAGPEPGMIDLMPSDPFLLRTGKTKIRDSSDFLSF